MVQAKNSMFKGLKARESMAYSSDFKLEHSLQEGKWQELRPESWIEASHRGVPIHMLRNWISS